MNLLKNKDSAKNLVLILILLVIISVSLFFAGILKKNCEQDKECFDSSLKRCSGAVYTSFTNGNIYVYESYPSFSDNCKFKVKVAKATPGAELNLRYSLEGKSMTCILPRSELQEKSFSENDNLAEFCTGPLKEAMYELIVQRMYSLVIANLGNISMEARKAVAGF